MCFVKDPNFKKHFVALEDIVCYKVLLKDDVPEYYRAPYFPFLYAVGKVFKHDINLDYMDNVDKLKGGVFHSYINLEIGRTKWVMAWGECFHYGFILQPRLCKCVIPKGSICWANDTEYASSTIKVLEEVEPFETVELKLKEI